MKITKLGHCCLLIEEHGVRILTDPGVFTTSQNRLKDLEAVLITHEHFDHFHVESVQEIVRNNPNVQVITNSAVAPLLKAAHVDCTVIADGEKIDVNGVIVEALESPHAEIHSSIPRILNTGFMVGNILFYPGDAFINPKRDIPLLAIPVAGPWMKISEAIDYGIELHPAQSFPVHDAVLKNSSFSHPLVQKILASKHISFTPLIEGESLEV